MTRESKQGLAALFSVIGMLLTPVKLLGFAITVCVWWYSPLLLVFGDPKPDPALFLALFFGFGFVFFGLFMPTYRWIQETAVSFQVGQPIPRWHRPRLSGGLWKKIDDEVSRTCAPFLNTGVVVHPSEDGLNDLGDTGGLPRQAINPYGYTNVAVGPWWTRPHCHHCQAVIMTSDRRCGHCGYYVHPNGAVDWDAQHEYEATA